MPHEIPVERQSPLEHTDLEKTLPANARPAERIFAGGGEMGSLIRSKDWAETPLGPVENWPQSLRTAISIMLSSSFAMVVAWGPDFRFFYNDRYRPVIGAKHPAALGTPAQAIFPEAWNFIGPLFARTRQGEAVALDDVLIPLERYGYLENCYFILSYSPIRDESGEVGGMLAVVAETTERVQSERRLKTLRDLARQASDMSTVEAALTGAAEILAGNPIDVPFALFYKLEDEGRRARLKGVTGLPAGGHATPEVIDLGDGPEKTWPLREALKTHELTVVDDLPARFGSLPGGPYPEATNMAVIASLSRPGQQNADGVVIFGVSPRRALDDQYRGFYELAADHILTAIRNAVARQEERERLQKLVELDRAKTLFFSNVSHEFRTPLTLILGPLEDMLHSPENKLQPEGQEQLAIIHRNSIRLLRLVNTLLDFSRIEAGRVQAAFEPTDLCQLTENLASGFRSAIEKVGLEFRVDCQPIPEAIYVDRDMWEKVVLNLLSNAFKFTFSGRITVTLKAMGETVELSVADTGTGIAPNELQRVFERFHRIEGVQARTHEGTGIGLALVHELVKLHGGSVRAESTVGKGSTFIVTLQKGRDHLPADRIGVTRSLASTTLGAASFMEEALRWLPDVEHSPQTGEPATTARQSHNQNQFTAKDAKGAKEKQHLTILRYAQGQAPEHEGKPKGTKEKHQNSSRENKSFKVSNTERPYILIADDNADMRRYLTRLLSEHYEVHAVADGLTALATLSHRTPDLILSDVMMPNLDGFGLVQKLRSNPETNTIPIILLSARAGEEARVEGMEQGADDYLIKPFSAGELLARVAAHVRLANIRREAEQALQASEERLRLAQQAAGIGTFEWDFQTNVNRWTPELEAMYGLPTGGFDGTQQAWERLIHPDDKASALKQVEIGLHTGNPIQAEWRVVWPDGSVHWIAGRWQVFKDKSGKPARMAGINIDITSRKTAEEAQRRLAAIVESSDDAIASKDLNGTVTSWNKGAERLFGYKAEEIIGKPITLIIPPELQGDEEMILNKIKRGEKIDHFETVRMNKNGERIEISVTISPIRDGHGNIVGAAKIVRNITENKKIEHALRITEKLAAAGRLAATVAHEINNPLEAATNLIYLARQGAGPGDVQEYLAGAEEELERVSHLTRQTLGFYRDTRGTTSTSVGSLVTPLLSVFSSRARNKAIEIRPEIKEHPKIAAVPGEIRQLLANLLSNSIDAVDGSGGMIRIRVCGAKDFRHEGRAGVRLTVADSGSGIPSAIRSKLFEPFFTTKMEVGTGLGLWVCQSIVEKHGGRISVKSSMTGSRRGTTFSVFLPLIPQSSTPQSSTLAQGLKQAV